MSSFAGVSMLIGDEVHTTPAVNTCGDSGYHLLVVNDYSRTLREIPNGKVNSSGDFMVGGHKWCICYCPNGADPSCADFISLFFARCCDDDGIEEPVEAKVEFSFVDQVEHQKQMHIRASKSYSFSSKSPSWGFPRFVRRDILERSGNLKGDCFTIRCDIMVCKDLNTKYAGGTVSDIHQHFDYLLQNKVGTDVTFEVSGETFAAHRCVLAARSTVFMAQLFGPMSEGTTSSAIQIKDMRAKVFAALLRFIYTDSFPEIDKNNYLEGDKAEVVEQRQEEEVDYVMWVQDLFVAADRYDLQRLKLLCEDLLSEHIGVSSVASTLALAEQHYCCGLKNACLKFIQVQSPMCVEKIMATDDWEHITMTYPSILNELISKLVSNQKDKKRNHERM
ncbi:BTB/POZ and MATH domain-containing protein 1-like [Lolium rigidum]|uniref:BTB/POZ and MATH domain-containing protein 1-like n=1 Tax=Lolium rigidum TaxID=89674 RepID=UPI001F5DA88A|nr:BTB/POZ and MATH domain-containing protein 1-like [Lolium rigidum]XP_047055238.1 BTB/POZ and MATH domain-containing protein 1-like [Lolium rigidum]